MGRLGRTFGGQICGVKYEEEVGIGVLPQEEGLSERTVTGGKDWRKKDARQERRGQQKLRNNISYQNKGARGAGLGAWLTFFAASHTRTFAKKKQQKMSPPFRCICIGRGPPGAAGSRRGRPGGRNRGTRMSDCDVCWTLV